MVYVALVLVFVLQLLLRYVASSRVRVTMIVREGLLEQADLLWRGVVDANQESEPALVMIHDSMIEMAAFAPLLSAGLVDTADGKPSESEREQIRDVFMRNAWILEHVIYAASAMMRLKFHSDPWNPKLWKTGFLGWYLMERAIPNGWVMSPSEAATSCDEFYKLKSERICDKYATI